MENRELPKFGSFGINASNNNRNMTAPAPVETHEPSEAQEHVALAPQPVKKAALATKPAQKAPKAKTAGTAKKKTEAVMVYLSEDDKEDIFMGTHKMKKSMTTFMESASLDALRYTYECTDPTCRCSFTLRRVDDEAPAKPKFCPVCGGQSISK